MKTNYFSNTKIRITFLSIMMVIGLFFASSAYAVVVSPTYSAVTGNWTDAVNWTPAAPVAGDNVIIPAGAIVTVSTDLSATKFNSLSVLGKLTVSATGIINIEQTVTVNPLVSIGGGEIQNDGTLSIKQTLANSNAAITFGNGTDADAKFINSGTMNIDMLASTISSASTRCVNFAQTTASRTCRFTLGGTMNFSVPTGTRFFELSGGANGVIDGTAVIGSVSDYKNWRLVHMGNGGTLTLAGSLEFYSGYNNASNGTISMSITASGSAVGNLINSGTLKLHGGSAVVAYGLYLNPQFSTTSGTANFTNSGTLLIDGTFPLGNIYLNGSTGTVATFTNQLGAVATLTNIVNSGTAVPLRASATASTTITNAGTLNLSSTALDASINTIKNTYSNTGTVNLNAVTDVKNTSDFKAKVYVNDQNIIVNQASDASCQLQLVDITGRIIKQANLKAEKNVVNIGNLKGIYIVRLLTATGTYSQKLSL